MGDFVVRLSSLTLQNIKNVKNGTIFMPMANEKSLSVSGAEILGIYGQNGSGKTAVVDALYFLQQIMIGQTIDLSISDYIGVDDDEALCKCLNLRYMARRRYMRLDITLF